MKTHIGKDFYWEMSHRLPFHEGLCKNIHGHTYRLRLELFGDLDSNGMLLDYYKMAQIIKPILDKLDHSFLCDSQDSLMINFLTENCFKLHIMEKTSTAEHIAEYLGDLSINEFKKYSNIEKMIMRVYETEDVFAEVELIVNE